MAKVLVVDDAAFMRMVLRKILEKGGHEVVGEGANGREGVEKYDELKPQVMVMDMVMPEMGGIDALRAIVGKDAKARIVMCSATGQEALINQAREAGACAFVSKPFQEKDVLDAVNGAAGL